VAYNLNPSEAQKLFQIRKPTEMKSFLSYLEKQAKGQWKWNPLGGRVANANSVELLTEPGPPIVERINNGIDAMLELRYKELDSPEIAPASPRKAAEEWFGIKGGTLNRKKDNQAINELAPNVRVEVYDSGEPRKPSVSICDQGIGQHPEDFPSTILSLGESNKIGKSYLCGAYGQGGSATFMWCDYTIIVSRRRPQHCNGKTDLVGWTIVRRWDDISLKLYTYQYLVTDLGKIPTFSSKDIDQCNFDYGMYVIHIGYDLGKLSTFWSIVGYRYLNNLLFDPVLPYTIKDHREPKPQDRYMYGSRGRLAAAFTEYSNEYVSDLGEDGILTVRYWVFHEKSNGQAPDSDEIGENVNSYLEYPVSSRIIVVTLNGQRHAYLDKGFIKSTIRYPLLSDNLLVQVDCDKLSQQRKKGLFTSTRSGIISGEKRLELIENAVKMALDEDPELRNLEQQRLKKRLAAVDDKAAAKVKKLLDQLITISKPLTGPGADSKGGVGQGPSGPKPYKPKDPPTFFKFAEEKEPLRIQAGQKQLIDIVTDGPNDMLTRKKRKGQLVLESVGEQIAGMQSRVLYNGRMGVMVAASAEAKPGSACQLRAQLSMEGGIYFTSQRQCQIVAPPPPYVGVDPPTKLIIKTRGNKVRLRRGGTTQVTVETNCTNDLLSRPIDPAYFEIETTLQGVQMIARRGPRGGFIHALLKTPDSLGSTSEETKNQITARLTLANGLTLENTQSCLVVDAPGPDKDRGKKKETKANYDIIEVWSEKRADRPNSFTWDQLHWDKTHVGKYDITKDAEQNDFLLLYVNMDNEDLVKERERRLKKSGESAMRRLDARYQTYVCHHMWLHNEGKTKSSTISNTAGDLTADRTMPSEVMLDVNQEQLLFDEEMRRVAKTIIIAMRSEADIFATLDHEESAE